MIPIEGRIGHLSLDTMLAAMKRYKAMASRPEVSRQAAVQIEIEKALFQAFEWGREIGAKESLKLRKSRP